MSNPETITTELATEFLRRVVNELKGRTFTTSEPPPQSGGAIIAKAKAAEVLHVLPEIVREFASQIEPAWTRCYRLNPTPVSEGKPYIAHDPISGVSIRCFKYWDVSEYGMTFRFEAAFS